MEGVYDSKDDTCGRRDDRQRVGHMDRKEKPLKQWSSQNAGDGKTEASCPGIRASIYECSMR